MPQGHGYEAAHPNQRSNPGRRATALRLVEMHPNRGQHHQLELPAELCDLSQVGKAVVQPFNLLGRVEGRSSDPHFGCRLDGDDAVSHCGQRSRVAPGAGTNIQDPTGGSRDQVQHRSVNLGKRGTLVSLDEFVCFFLRILRYRSPMSCRDPRPWGIADRVPQDQRCRQQHDRAGLMTDGERDRHDEEQGRDAERHL